ncbi:Uncharacterised protein [Mycobacterium tuberculosis]|nr:Uncharacterised protein [Mycobacterium tuberculosis]
MTPSFPRTGVSGHAGAVHRHRRDRRRVSVLSRGFGSDDVIFSPGEVKEIDVEFPSPLGVLGLTTTRISAKPVSAIQFPSPLGVLGLTTSRTICSSPGSMRFPSPLGVLGLTTSDSISPGGQQISHVSVPSRGFGSDDRPVAARLPPPLLTWFPSPLGVLGLTTRKSTRAGVERCPVSVPSRGFGSDDMRIRCQHMGFRVFPSPLGVLGLTT